MEPSLSLSLRHKADNIVNNKAAARQEKAD
jgi:hypothetical protein